MSINRLSIRRFRRRQKKEIAEDIKRSYSSSNNLIVHWDGKMLPENDNQKVDRLSLIVTDLFGTAKLLGVPQLSSGTEKQ